MPFLLTATGWQVPESTSIIEYLEDEFPDSPRLIPQSGRGTARQVRFVDRIADLYYNNPIVELLFQQIGFRPQNAETADRATKLVQMTYAHWDTRLDGQPWLCGATFTMADCAALPAMYYAETVAPFASFANVAAYWQRAQSRLPTLACATSSNRYGRAWRDNDRWHDRPRLMKVDVVTDIRIDRPVEDVARFAAEPSNVPKWYANIKSVEWRSPPIIAVGAKIAFIAHFLGRRLEYTYEIVEYVRNQRLVMRTADGPFPMETTYEWRPDDGGTRMLLRNRGEPRGFSSLLAPFMAGAVRRANRKDLAALKAVLERDP